MPIAPQVQPGEWPLLGQRSIALNVRFEPEAPPARRINATRWVSQNPRTKGSYSGGC